jgi:hypothetical protein
VPNTTTSSWLLRAASFVAIAAAIAAVIVAPGLRGNAGDVTVHYADVVSAFLAFLLASMLMAVVLGGALQILLSSAPAAVRVGLVTGGATVVAICFAGLRERLPGQLTVILAVSASVAALAAAYFAARGPHTRATAGVLFAFAFATIARVGGWVAATRAGDSANMELFATARNLATAGVVLEAAGQVIAFYWLGRRSRAFGQLAAFVAVGAAVAVTVGVARGGHADAAPWQAVVHSALGDPAGVPPSARVAALATMLVPSSIFLALGVAVQPGQVSVVVAAMALALVSRGSFDAPLRALCAVAAAQWAALACVDEKAMWTMLISDRRRRLAEDGLDGLPPLPPPAPRDPHADPPAAPGPESGERGPTRG